MPPSIVAIMAIIDGTRLSSPPPLTVSPSRIAIDMFAELFIPERSSARHGVTPLKENDGQKPTLPTVHIRPKRSYFVSGKGVRNIGNTQTQPRNEKVKRWRARDAGLVATSPLSCGETT